MLVPTKIVYGSKSQGVGEPCLKISQIKAEIECMRAGEVVCKCSICVNCVHLMQPQRRKEEGWCAAFRSVCNVCNVQCTVSKGGGEGGVHVALITSCIILQCHRRRERWMKVCSLCKMGEVVNKWASV